MKVRRAVAGLAATACVTGVTVSLPSAAGASPVPTGATATSTGLVVSPGNGITASLNLTGAVGALLGPLVNPVLDAVSSTLLTALVGNPAANPPVPGLVSNLVSGLSSLTGTSATTPTTQVTNPAPSFPSCTAAGWTSSTCYALTNLGTGALSSLIGLTVPTIQGYTDADPSASNNQPMTGRAHIADPTISLLGISIGDLGVIDATSTCPTSNSSSDGSAATLGATSSLAGISLLGGLVKASVASSTGLLMVQIGSASAVAVGSLATQLLSLAGLNVSVASAGNNGLRVTVQLGLTNLLSGLGLSAINGLTGLSGNTVGLSVTIAPGSKSVSVGAGSASATGLEVKVGLSGTLGLNILGLVGAALTIAPASGSGDADLLDLQLARTSCSGGVATSGPVWYPPGLI